MMRKPDLCELDGCIPSKNLCFKIKMSSSDLDNIRTSLVPFNYFIRTLDIFRIRTNFSLR